MKLTLYDHRGARGTCRFFTDLGIANKFTLTAAGDLQTRKTDYLYSLRIHLSPTEMETLRQRLNDLHEKKKTRDPIILLEAEQILKERGEHGDS